MPAGNLLCGACFKAEREKYVVSLSYVLKMRMPCRVRQFASAFSPPFNSAYTFAISEKRYAMAPGNGDGKQVAKVEAMLRPIPTATALCNDAWRI